MKVLFQARFSLFEIKGGDTVQIESTKAELEKLGVDVEGARTASPHDGHHVPCIDLQVR